VSFSGPGPAEIGIKTLMPRDAKRYPIKTPFPWTKWGAACITRWRYETGHRHIKSQLQL